ncbi:hypothetical protein [Methanosarcina sp.]|nr:hypothetical protein [Methanosarcina sp.]MDW5549523.1 hypothetical protein [Methanosarcina sp.]MDW5553557.1 hypothetical protein [Methanosarcina sp.]MDW5558639.1 hypothetical protein [Methanosarcina sp.]
MGSVHEEMKVSEDVIPAEEAVQIILRALRIKKDNCSTRAVRRVVLA